MQRINCNMQRYVNIQCILVFAITLKWSIPVIGLRGSFLVHSNAINHELRACIWEHQRKEPVSEVSSWLLTSLFTCVCNAKLWNRRAAQKNNAVTDLIPDTGPAPRGARPVSGLTPPIDMLGPPQLTSFRFWKQRLLCLISNFCPPIISVWPP